MTGVLRIAKLDFFTMKSQAVMYVSLVLMILMFGFMDSSVTLLGINGAWFTALFSSNIFAVQEKNNLDRLYGSVSVSLKDIVLGRYIFVFLNYLLSFLVVTVVYSGFALFQGKVLELPDFILGFSLSFFVFSAITGGQMPLFFKLGYTKAKVWSMVPFIAVMVMVAAQAFVPALSGIVEFIGSNRPALIAGAILAGCMIEFFSCQAAVAAYRRRKRG